MTEQPNISTALAAVMGDLKAVGKDGFHDAPGAKFKFRGIDAVVNAVSPALRKHHVIVSPQQVAVNYRDVTTSSGKASRECTVLVTYRFHGPAGDHIDVMAPGEAMDNGDKGTAKAMSVAFRIALLQALCLPTDDPDPDSTVYERGHAAPPSQRNASPKSSLSEADVAKAKLRQSCQENGWDMTIVADLYAGEKGVELKETTNAAVIEKFRQSLFAIPTEQLKVSA